MTSTSCLIARPDLIDAHLLAAAMSGTSVVMHIGGERITGRLDLADGFGEVTVLIDPSQPRIPRGLPVEVRYSLEGRRFAFSSRLLARVNRTRLRLVRPRRVQAEERRLAARQAGKGMSAATGDGAAVAVGDISMRGARIRLPAESLPMRAGERRQLWLTVAGASFPVVVEASNVRVDGWTGVGFVDIQVQDQARLVAFLDGEQRLVA